MRFQKSKPWRIRRYFWRVVVDGHWWVDDAETFVPTDIMYGLYSNSNARNGKKCRTLRAFKRMLRKHPHIKGKATLISRYAGYNVYA